MRLEELLLLSQQGSKRRVFTRDEVCAVQLTFQGLTITTQQFGTQPWFEPAYQCLTDSADRASVRQQKLTAGDTHLILEFFTHEESIYNESGQPWQQAISPSGEDNQQWFRGLVDELLDSGIVPIVAFDGDNGDAVGDGYPNALRQLPILAALLGDLQTQILFARFWDGVFYGSSPANIAAFGQSFRQYLPNGNLAIEHQPGRIPIGNGPADWGPNGPMQTYDVICSEFMDGALAQDSTWQVGGRLLGPAYKRPPEQPSGDDPNPPWYLSAGTPRGPYYAIAFEYFAYEWVRSWVTPTQVQTDRDYLNSLGWSYIC